MHEQDEYKMTNNIVAYYYNPLNKCCLVLCLLYNLCHDDVNC